MQLWLKLAKFICGKIYISFFVIRSYRQLVETTNAPLSVLLYILVWCKILPFAFVIERVLKGVKVLRCEVFNLRHRHNRWSGKIQHSLKHGGNALTALQNWTLNSKVLFLVLLAQLCQKKENI